MTVSLGFFITSYSNSTDNNLSDSTDVPEVKNAVDSLYNAQLLDSVVVLAQKAQAPIKEFLASCLKLSKLNKDQLIALKRDMQRLIQVTQELDELRSAIDTKSTERFVELVHQELEQEIAEKKCTFSDGELAFHVDDASLNAKANKIKSLVRDELQKSKLLADYTVINKEFGELQVKVNHFLMIVQRAIMQKINDLNGEFIMIRDVLAGALLTGISETVGQTIDECIEKA